MRREEHIVGDTFTYRFADPAADHVLLVQHGIGGHGGIYDTFAAHYADLGAEVWCMDAPGHGRSCVGRRAGQFTLEEWIEAALRLTDHIRTTTGLPVFIKGSSLGASAAYGAYAASEAFAGAILMGFAIPSSPLIPADNPFRTTTFEQMIAKFGPALRFDIEQSIDFDTDYGFPGAGRQKHQDPLNTWTYDLSSWASIARYDPAVPLSANTKPILFAVGEKDPIFTPAMAQTVVDATGGPVDFHIHPGGVHQLMLFHTADYAQVVRTWCHKQLLVPTTAERSDHHDRHPSRRREPPGDRHP
ncbi:MULTISPECIES: alpha/beta hydrolase [unclassified Nocardia]|uniref:alpha/beta hydrolase n=1 Tax=unclassified Nocardia TaxID=2637762 RepID=UPI001CE4934D|nr:MULTISPECIES: alpha/beta fold hydrolase [unclassified Nocardia]